MNDVLFNLPLLPVDPKPDPATNRRGAAAIDLAFTYATVAVAVIKGVILVPLYLKYFSLATYGSWLAAANILAAFGFFETGLNFVYRQRLSFAFGKRDDLAFARIAGSGAPMFFAFGSLFVAVGLAISPLVPIWTKAGDANAAVSLGFAFAAVGTALTLIQNSLCAVSLAWQNTLFIGAARLGAYSIEVAVVVIGLWLGLEVAALGLGTLAGASFGAAVTAVYVGRKWRQLKLGRPNVVQSELFQLVKSTAPVFLSKAGNQLTRNSEEFLTTLVAGPKAAAVLALTRKGFDLGQLVANPIAGSVFSGLAHLAGERGPRKTTGILREVFVVSTLLTSLVVPVVLGVNREFVSRWVGPESFGGFWLNLGLAVSTILVIRGNLLGSVVAALGEIRKPAYSGLAEMAIRMASLVLLMPTIGLFAVPMSSILGIVAVTVWYLPLLLGRVIGDRASAMRIQFAGVQALTLSCVIGFLVATALPITKNWVGLAMKTVIMTILTSVVVFVANGDARSSLRRAIIWSSGKARK